MKHTRLTAFFLCGTLLAAAASGDLRGMVRDLEGKSIAGAEVRLASEGPPVRTAADGSFVLVGVDPPARLRIEASGYSPAEVVAQSADSAIELARAAVAEELLVAAEARAGSAFAPIGFAATVVAPEQTVSPPHTLTELVASTPGVAENGQGGLFQVVSIRGFSRQRVATRLAGAPILAERRAGVSTSFVDPELIGEVGVVRGPAGVAYGTGAFGGVIEVIPLETHAERLTLGWSQAGDERALAGSGGDPRLVYALAGRAAGDSEAADGMRLYSRYQQGSALVRLRLGDEHRAPFELMGLASFGDHIAKPNSLVPREITLYPRERHLLLRADGQVGASWSWAAHLHPNDLETRTLTPTSREQVENEALDFGARVERTADLPHSGSLVVVGEWNGRRGVRAFEQLASCSAGVDGDGLPAPNACVVDGEAATLDEASLDELSLAMTWQRTLGPATVQLGSRGTYERQDDRGVDATDELALVGFAGLAVPLGGGFEASAHLGTGARLPTLSERLYSGLTGAGRIIGNPELEPERSVNAELGLRWLGRRGLVAVHGFRNQVDDYIERLEVEPDLFSYRNLVSGTIEGVELETSWRPGGGWHLAASAQHLRGEDRDARTLPDVPADRLRLELEREHDGWGWGVEWVHRFEKEHFGSGEVALGEADLLATRVDVVLTLGLVLTVDGRNLLDEDYRPTADRRASPATGRAVGLTLRWTPP